MGSQSEAAELKDGRAEARSGLSRHTEVWEISDFYISIFLRNQKNRIKIPNGSVNNNNITFQVFIPAKNGPVRYEGQPGSMFSTQI